MKKINIAIVLFLLVFFSAFGQTPEEALRYSRLNYATGNAKAASMAGSIGALGGNFASLSINPAGIGVYRSSEFTFTPSILYSTANTNYLGNNRKSETINFNIGNFGFVFSLPASGNASKIGFRYFQFGLGVNRTNNFHRDIVMKGFNDKNSITTQWVDEVNSLNPNIQFDGENPIITNLDPFSTNLAWETYAIDWATDANGKPYIFSDMEGGGVEQTVRMATLGSMNEFVFSGGFNYLDQLFVGATLGVPYFSYKEEFRITEEDTENLNDFFGSVRYTTILRTSGAGVNFKFGAIYKPIQWLRIGAAIHTPTRYNMDDSYFAEVVSFIDLNGGRNYIRRNDDANNLYSYILRTPLKVIGSVGFVIGKHGSVNVDYTYLDYSNARFKDNNFSFDYANELISTNYRAGHNIAIGTEWVFGVFKVRAGYAYETSPYVSKEINSGGDRMTIGAGAGVTFGRFYTDFGYAYLTEDIDFYPYDRAYGNMSKNKYNSNQFQLTFGFRF